MVDELLYTKFGELGVVDLRWGWFPLEVVDLRVNFFPLVHWVWQILIVVILHYWLSWLHYSSHNLRVISWEYHEFKRDFMQIILSCRKLWISFVSCFSGRLQFLAFSFKLFLGVHFMFRWKALDMLKMWEFFFLIWFDWFLLLFLNFNH